MGGRKTYEVRIGGKLVCRGSSDECADALGIGTDTLRRYRVDPNCPKYVSVVSLPSMYLMEKDGKRFLGTPNECASFVGRSRDAVFNSAAHGTKLNGWRVEKQPYVPYRLRNDVIDGLITAERAKRVEK